jgi:hypothetical protein
VLVNLGNLADPHLRLTGDTRVVWATRAVTDRIKDADGA